MPVATLGGVPTHWVEAGQGVRPVLFIHCSLAHSGAWKRVMAALEDKLAMRAFDIPGHGRSGDLVPGSGDFQDAIVAQALGLIDGRADVIGHSFGATAALRLARDHPDKVRSVVLVEPVLFAAAKDQPEFEIYKDEMAPFVQAMQDGDHESAARVFDAVWGAGLPWEEIPEHQRAGFVARVPLVAQGSSVTDDDVHGQAAPGALEQITQPVLLLEGSNSPAIIGAIHRVLAARLPDARRVVVAGAGHMLPVTHPQAVAGEIAAFLKV